MQGLNLKAIACAKPLQNIVSKGCNGYSSVRSLWDHVLDVVNKPKRKMIADVKNYRLNKQKDSELLYF